MNKCSGLDTISCHVISFWRDIFVWRIQPNLSRVTEQVGVHPNFQIFELELTLKFASGNSTEVYFHGTQITTTLLGVIPATIIMHQITTPILYNLKLYSINEYLQLRYQSAALRKVGTSVVLLNTSFHIGMSVYAPSLALATVTSISPINSVLIAGAIVTFYITVGGVKAVVYTDVLQTLLMLAGVLAVVVICCMKVGGVEEVWATAGQGGRLEFFK
ncbi:putative sodium-dependent multivitamin transporter [Portunus trituberculatus]|uniref:Putative sodium-dependent multivitamin transporter n=1 Tax=Portunus trituberculatus TaxID=210409 RepID=A0A5B7FB40_PORTR|nr:putative sodium-dependent multivitamin transporter [Portunus trituberculatus]